MENRNHMTWVDSGASVDWSYLFLGDRRFGKYQDNKTYFFHQNNIGTTGTVTDQTGATIQDVTYYPWGQEWVLVGTWKDKRFASLHQRNDEASLDPTHFRMFSSTQGRWFSTDPVHGQPQDPQTLNLYTYVGNIPTSRTDPEGNQFTSSTGCYYDPSSYGSSCYCPDPCDHLSYSLTHPEDQTGATIQDVTYYPWGQEWILVGTWKDKRFASLHERHAETNADPTLFRMFSSTQGRWFSTDPAQTCGDNPQGLNRYAYVANSPTNRIDPGGDQWGGCGDPFWGCGPSPCDDAMYLISHPVECGPRYSIYVTVYGRPVIGGLGGTPPPPQSPPQPLSGTCPDGTRPTFHTADFISCLGGGLNPIVGSLNVVAFTTCAVTAIKCASLIATTVASVLAPIPGSTIASGLITVGYCAAMVSTCAYTGLVIGNCINKATFCGP